MNPAWGARGLVTTQLRERLAFGNLMMNLIGTGETRRSFLAKFQGLILGRFLMPALPGAEIAASVATATDAAVKVERVRNLLSLPQKHFGKRPGYFTLWWMEELEDGRREFMMWRADHKDELPEMQRFYDSARGSNIPIPSIELPVRTLEEQRLIEAVVSSDEREGPLREYGRWLTAKGDLQGEFIEMAVRAWEHPEGTPEYLAAHKRWQDLFRQHARDWVKPLAALNLSPMSGGMLMPSFWLMRGVLAKVNIPNSQILPGRARELFGLAPFLHTITLEYEKIDTAGLAKCPLLWQIETFVFKGKDLNATQLREFIRSPHLTRLRTLDVSRNPLGPAGARACGESALVSQLHTLIVSGCDLGDEGVRWLFKNDDEKKLQEVDLSSNSMTAQGAGRLVDEETLTSLTTLDLSENPLEDVGALALAHGVLHKQIERLRLNECGLAKSDTLFQLLQAFPKLVELTVSKNQLQDADWSNGLPAGTSLPLESLDVSKNSLTGTGLCALLTSGMLPHLKQLVAEGIPGIGDLLAGALASSPDSRMLKSLDLSNTDLSVKGVRALCKSPHLTHLKELQLKGNNLTAAGATMLAHSPNFRGLKLFWLSKDGVGEKGEAALERAFPNHGLIVFRG